MSEAGSAGAAPASLWTSSRRGRLVAWGLMMLVLASCASRPMGAPGAVVIWDLAALPSAPSWVRARAGQWLRSPAFRKAAPRSLIVAADLRTAQTCEAALALLPEAKQVADERSLQQLIYWTQKTGCGRGRKHDCMPCLRKDSSLDETIAAIRARNPKPTTPSAAPAASTQPAR